MKKGFSLSEVLIALGIIGVVAAITLPPLVHNFQKLVLKNQYKRVYSNYSNALQKYVADNEVPDCYYGTGGLVDNHSGCVQFYNTLMSQYLKSLKYCENNALASGCIPKYKAYVSNDGGCRGFSENKINNSNKVFILNDGSSFICYNNGRSCNMALFQVDINGKKGPNKGSYDLFAFAIQRIGDTLKLIPHSGCFPYTKGGLVKNQDISEIYK